MRHGFWGLVALAACSSSGSVASDRGDGTVVQVDAGPAADAYGLETQGGATDGAATSPDAALSDSAALALKLNVTAAKNAGGQLCVNVTASGEGFPDNASASVAVVCAPFAQLPVVVQGLTVGNIYGVSVFLDLNGNQKLDTNAFGIPTEGFGFSNNPTIGFGPPTWDQVKFTFGPATAEQTLKLTYFL